MPKNTVLYSQMELENSTPSLSASFPDLQRLLNAQIPLPPQLKQHYKRLLGNTRIVDLLYHFPTRIEERLAVYTFADIQSALATNPKCLMTTLFTTTDYVRPKRRGMPLVVHGYLEDETPAQIKYFNGNWSWIQKLYPLSLRKTITGTCALSNGLPVFTHPDHVAPAGAFEGYIGNFPVYPLTAGIAGGPLRALIQKVLAENTPDLPEWIEPSLLHQQNWPSWKEALKQMHAPEVQEDLDPATSKAYQRLVYDELLARQLNIATLRQKTHKTPGRQTANSKNLAEKLEHFLPFQLTPGQQSALKTIYQDMLAPTPMRRLLQGDVGCGKTLVGLTACLYAIESGHQTAFLAPTEILARQHAVKLAPLCSALGISIDLLVGGQSKTKQGSSIRGRIASGTTKLVVGTHALLEDPVNFHDLGLVIIDEQHRFGVAQRLKLIEKGPKVDMLAMSATPIPRSLQLTLFGDMNVTTIPDKPSGRQPIQTIVMDQDRLHEAVAGLERHFQTGAQAYWVCPLVEESEKLDLSAAEARYQQLSQQFQEQVGLVHGKMKPKDKDAIMQRFVACEIKLLIATTVIEVGVDVPNATLMIIEHAERFGLSQLHQLRGRVGRGSTQSHCLLVYSHPLSDNAKTRLSVMRESNDGFYIAEEDLKLRGGGDIYGTQQSGWAIFKLADLRRDLTLLRTARDEAELKRQQNHVNSDPVKCLLMIFNQEDGEDYRKAG